MITPLESATVPELIAELVKRSRTLVIGMIGKNGSEGHLNQTDMWWRVACRVGPFEACGMVTALSKYVDAMVADEAMQNDYGPRGDAPETPDADR